MIRLLLSNLYFRVIERWNKPVFAYVEMGRINRENR